MYTQFFGNYLLNHNYVTKEQLFKAIECQTNTRLKLGTIAINNGMMTAANVDEIIVQQTHQNKKFGELAVENGYLTEAQVQDLLREQVPDFLLLAQILVDENVISNSDFETIISDYREQNEMNDLDLMNDNKEIVVKMIRQLSDKIGGLSEENQLYIELLFNNFIRFVGEDFTLLPVEIVKSLAAECAVSQDIVGNVPAKSYIATDKETAISFASRYAGEKFQEYDEYVKAAMEDFVNLHNGLYIVNLSNMKSEEYTIMAPVQLETGSLEFSHTAILFPVLYSFGTVNFVVELI